MNINDYILSASYPLDDTSFKCPTPKKIKVELKPHQKAVLYRAKQLEDTNGYELINTKKLISENPQMYSELSNLSPKELNNFLSQRNYNKTKFVRCAQLSDNVGSGKSLEALSLIATDFEYNPKEIKTVIVKGNKFKMIDYIREEYKIIPCNYLLVPHNIIYQWQKYIETQTSLSYVMFNKPKNSVNLSSKELEKIICDESKNIKYDIILVSNTVHNKFFNNLKSIFYTKSTHSNYLSFSNSTKFSRLIIDECRDMKLPNGQGENNFYFTWGISATLNYPNNTGVLSNFAYEINCSIYIGRTTISSDNEFVKKSFELPEPSIEILIAKAKKIFNIFSTILNKQVQEMLKKDDINGVMEAIGIKTYSEEKLIKFVTTDIEETIENLKIDLESTEKKKYKNEKSKEEVLNKIKDKIKENEDKIKSIEERIKAEDLDPITYTNIENPILTPCCKNKYELDSILNWFKYNNKSTCPICRSNINPEKLIHIKDINNTDEEIKDKNDVKKPTFNTKDHNRLENLEYLLKNKIPKNSSILIFSEHESFLGEISEIFKKNCRGSLKQLSGQSTHISKLIEEYKQKKQQALFLNARFYGSGLNLENTDYLIMMHKMSPHIEKQVIGRAQRPGRTNQLKIFKIYCENE